jgi:hypothetical protein
MDPVVSICAAAELYFGALGFSESSAVPTVMNFLRMLEVCSKTPLFFSFVLCTFLHVASAIGSEMLFTELKMNE